MRTAQFRKIGLVAVGVFVGFVASLARAQGEFPLKDGDTWVMVGDSITAQHLHSNYFEAFCYARFPKLTFCIRNSGVGGDTIPKVLARFDYDVALIDLMIAEINGLELARRIRSRHPRVVTILMSDYLLSPVQLAKANTGVVGFVPKPCRFEEVARFIRAKLESRFAKDTASAAQPEPHADPQAPFDVLSVQFAW